jgi:hypothetical protein
MHVDRAQPSFVILALCVALTGVAVRVGSPTACRQSDSNPTGRSCQPFQAVTETSDSFCQAMYEEAAEQEMN